MSNGLPIQHMQRCITENQFVLLTSFQIFANESVLQMHISLKIILLNGNPNLEFKWKSDKRNRMPVNRINKLIVIKFKLVMISLPNLNIFNWVMMLYI